MNSILTLLHSYSQVFLQKSYILGILIIVGLAIASPLGLMSSLLGVLTSVGAARVFGAPISAIENGIYGFNGVLIGIVASVFIKQVPLVFAITIISSILGALILHVFYKNHLSALSFPFVLMGWAIILTAKYFK